MTVLACYRAPDYLAILGPLFPVRCMAGSALPDFSIRWLNKCEIEGA